MGSMEEYYIISAYDPATPSFITSSITYLCTKEQWDKEPLKYTRDIKKISTRFVGEIRDYSNIMKYDFINLWDATYVIRFKGLVVEYVYIEIERIFYRYYYATMDQVYYTVAYNHRKHRINDNWGNNIV